MKRYFVSSGFYGTDADEDPEGEWVKYEDAKTEIDRLNALLESQSDAVRRPYERSNQVKP